MAVRALPAFAVGLVVIVRVFVAVVTPQLPPTVVKVKVMVPDSEAPAV
jgi:hypothetical protein